MSKSNQHRLTRWVPAGTMMAALLLSALPAAAIAGTPAARLQAAHRSKTSLKTLKSRPGEFKPATAGPVSPYARAAAERNAARQLPGNHPPPSRVPGTSP